MLVEVLLSLATVCTLLYFYLTKNYDYWRKKGVVFVKPQFPFGIFQDNILGRKDLGSLIQQFYTEHKRNGHKYFGSFSVRKPTLDVIDLDICKQILTKDFSHFVTRGLTPTSHEYITKHLFALEGQEWKDMRTKLTPTFTSGKMKNMFELMLRCTQQLQQHIEQEVLQEGEFEVKDLMARFTTDIIATCAFGLDVNSVQTKDHEFFKMGQLIFQPKMSTLLKVNLIKTFPVTSRILKVSLIDRVVKDTMTSVIKETEEYRKKNQVVRNDFVDLLLKVKENQLLDDHEYETTDGHKSKVKQSYLSGSHHKQSQHKQGLTLEEMTAQAFAFFAAGFETAASTTSFCLYELSKNTEVQDRLRREIDEVLSRHEGEITYQALQEMTYMDQVINETLRMYASLPFLTRVCTQKYQVPGTDLVLDKGVQVNIPTYAIHHDPDIYPDPYTFDPDRFSEQNSKDRHNYAFLPFGEGPRNCIGMRFGKLQVKIGLAAIMSRFQVTPAPDTPSKLEINPYVLITTPKHPFKLSISTRSDL